MHAGAHAHIQNLCLIVFIKFTPFSWTDFYQYSINFFINKLYVSVLGYAKFNFVDVKSQSDGTSVHI